MSARLEQKRRWLGAGLLILTSMATASAEPVGEPLLDLKAGTGDNYLRENSS